MELLADFCDGVCFIALAPISDPDLVIPTIAQALALRETGEQSPCEHLKTYLRGKQLLSSPRADRARGSLCR